MYNLFSCLPVIFLHYGHKLLLSSTLGLDQGTCFRTTKINVSQTVNLETPVVFYRHNYSKIYVS